MVLASSRATTSTRRTITNDRNGQVRGAGHEQSSAGCAAAQGTGAIGPSIVRITSPTENAEGRIRSE